jgi:hypothetical protein
MTMRRVTTMREIAEILAKQMRDERLGFRTIYKDALRKEFNVGRMTKNQSNEVAKALSECDIMVYPLPHKAQTTMRLYDRQHLIGQVAWAVLNAEGSTDRPLREAARVIERERAGRELRSDDVPWIDAFDVLLQVTFGREPDGWEDLRDDRHGTMLARDLAEALDFDAGMTAQDWFIRMAAAVCALRPRQTHTWRSEHLMPPEEEHAPSTMAFVETLTERDRRASQEHRAVLVAAAKGLLKGRPIPERQVELGELKLRRRRESLDQQGR